MPTEPEVPPQRIDGRKVGLSTRGYPLRKIVERVNGIHALSCGHKLPRPAEATDYDLRKSRRCVECGPQKKVAIEYVPVSALASMEAALRQIAELEGDDENQKFKLTRFQAAQVARLALTKARRDEALSAAQKESDAGSEET